MVYKYVHQELLHHSRDRELLPCTEQVPGAGMESRVKKQVKKNENIQFPNGNNHINVLLTLSSFGLILK